MTGMMGSGKSEGNGGRRGRRRGSWVRAEEALGGGMALLLLLLLLELGSWVGV